MMVKPTSSNLTAGPSSIGGKKKDEAVKGVDRVSPWADTHVGPAHARKGPLGAGGFVRVSKTPWQSK
jgi:hypothetical protein